MAAAQQSAFNLSDTYVFLEDGGSAPRIHVTDTFWRDLMSGAPRSPEAALVAGGSGWLAAIHRIMEDTRAWEMHPNGDELLAMLSGAMAVVLQLPQGEELVELREGMGFIVPKGIWHRQVVRAGGEFLAATYGRGTQHRALSTAGTKVGEAELPDVAAILGAVLQRVPVRQRPLLIALAERMAAERYRGWAEQVAGGDRQSGLVACADREEEIARRVEALYSDAASVQREILSGNPDLEAINRSVFAARPLHEQFAIQAVAERLGAATWRSFAQEAESDEVRQTLLGCAHLEEESAAYLESLLRGRA
jgi:mannose-6-phosphate isomerase-like protein (cupin superfamily)